jgi:putative protease
LPWVKENVEENLTGVQSGPIKAESPAWDNKEVGMQEKEIGKVTHYYGHLDVGIIELTDTLKVGESIHVKGHSEDFNQIVDSIQIEHANVPEAAAGSIVGIKFIQKAHPHDKVYKIIP